MKGIKLKLKGIKLLLQQHVFIEFLLFPFSNGVLNGLYIYHLNHTESMTKSLHSVHIKRIIFYEILT